MLLLSDAITLEANSTAAHTTVYTATATDAENDTLTYSMEVLPNTGIFVIRGKTQFHGLYVFDSGVFKHTHHTYVLYMRYKIYFSKT